MNAETLEHNDAPVDTAEAVALGDVAAHDIAPVEDRAESTPEAEKNQETEGKPAHVQFYELTKDRWDGAQGGEHVHTFISEAEHYAAAERARQKAKEAYDEAEANFARVQEEARTGNTSHWGKGQEGGQD